MYKELNERLAQSGHFRGSAVAIAFLNEPPSLEALPGKMRFCEMLHAVQAKGQAFYTTSEHHACNGGAFYTGLRAMPEAMKSGEFLHTRIGLFGSARAARRFLLSNIGVEPGTVRYLAFAPLAKAPFAPDVVVLICPASTGMRVAEAAAYETGITPEGRMGPLCSTLAAAPYLSGKVIYTLGDSGGRPYLQADEGDVFIGVPFERLEALLIGLEAMEKRVAQPH